MGLFFPTTAEQHVILQLSWHGWCSGVRTSPSGDTGLGWEAGGGGVCGPASWKAGSPGTGVSVPSGCWH